MRIAYRSFNSTLPKVVCVLTHEHSYINNTRNFTPSALKDYHVVVIAMLGNGESSSPSNTAAFPQPLYQDCVNASYELFKHINIKELEAVVGFGMGGQQAYYWMCMYPDFVKSAVVICGSARTSTFNQMLLDGTAAALSSSAIYTIENARQQAMESTAGPHG